jgi:hypothetical protein
VGQGVCEGRHSGSASPLSQGLTHEQRLEGFQKEGGRREGVLRLFPTRESVIGRLRALLSEFDEPGTTGCRDLEMVASWQWRTAPDAPERR